MDKDINVIGQFEFLPFVIITSTKDCIIFDGKFYFYNHFCSSEGFKPFGKKKKKWCCPYLMMYDVTRYDSVAFQFMARVIKMNRHEKVIRKK